MSTAPNSGSSAPVKRSATAASASPAVAGTTTGTASPGSGPLAARPRSPSSKFVRDTKRPANRVGRAATGLYPDVSRTKIAEATGWHISTVAGILQGRVRAQLDWAVIMAKIVGVTPEQLNKDLKAQQERYKERKSAKKAAARKKQAAERY